MNRRDDYLYPIYSKRGQTIARPKPQPKPRNLRAEELKAQILIVAVVLGIIAGIFLAGRG